MKKYLLVLLLAIVIVPSIASASWWNPASWGFFQSFFRRADPQTQVLENRTKEFENKLGVTATSTNTNTEKDILSSDTTSNVQKSISPKPKEKTSLVDPKKETTSSDTKPTVQITTTPPAEVTKPQSYLCNGQTYKSCPTGEKFVCMADKGVCASPTQLKDLTTCNGKTYYTVCSDINTKFVCKPEIGVIGCISNSNLNSISSCNGKTYSTCPSGTYLSCPSDGGNATCLKTDQQKTRDYQQSLLDAVDAKNQARIQEEENRKNSSECVSATSQLESIRREMKPMQNKLDKYHDNYLATGNYDNSQEKSSLIMASTPFFRHLCPSVLGRTA